MALWHVPGIGIINDAEQGVPEGAQRLPEYRNTLQYGSTPIQWDPRVQALGGQPWQSGAQETAPGYLTELLGMRYRVETGQAQPYEVEQYRRWETEARAIPTREIASLQSGWGGAQDWWQRLDPMSPDVGPITMQIYDRLASGQATDQERQLFTHVIDMAGDWNQRASVPQASDVPFGPGDQFTQAIMALTAATGGAGAFGAFGAGAGAGAAAGAAATEETLLAAAPAAAAQASPTVLGVPTSTLGTIGNVSSAAGFGANTLGGMTQQQWLRDLGMALSVVGGVTGGAAAAGNIASGTAGTSGGGLFSSLLGGGGGSMVAGAGSYADLVAALGGLGLTAYGAVNAGQQQGAARNAAEAQMAFAQQQAAFQQQILTQLLGQQQQYAQQVEPIRGRLLQSVQEWGDTGQMPPQMLAPQAQWQNVGRQSAWQQPGGNELASFMQGGALPTAAQGPAFREYAAPAYQSLLAGQPTWSPTAIQGYQAPQYRESARYQQPGYRESAAYQTPDYERPAAYQAPNYQQYTTGTREQTEQSFQRARESLLAQSGGQPSGVLARQLQQLEMARNSQLAANRQVEVERMNTYDMQNAVNTASFGTQQANAINQYMAQNAQFGANLGAQQTNAANQWNAQNAQFGATLGTAQDNARNQWMAQNAQFGQSQAQQAGLTTNAQQLAYTQGLQQLAARNASEQNQFNQGNAQFGLNNYNQYRQQMASIGANLYGTGLQYGQNETQQTNEHSRWNATNAFQAQQTMTNNTQAQLNALYNTQTQLATGLPGQQYQGTLGAGSLVGNPGSSFAAAGNLFQNIGTSTAGAQQAAGQAFGGTLGNQNFQTMLSNALSSIFGPSPQRPYIEAEGP